MAALIAENAYLVPRVERAQFNANCKPFMLVAREVEAIRREQEQDPMQAISAMKESLESKLR